jgi:hypothetical protein
LDCGVLRGGGDGNGDRQQENSDESFHFIWRASQQRMVAVVGANAIDLVKIDLVRKHERLRA